MYREDMSERFRRKLISGIIFFGIAIALILIGIIIWTTASGWGGMYAYLLWLIAVIPFLIGVGLLVVSAVIKGRMEKLEKVKEKKKMIGVKMEAASNVSYMLRIEKEVGDSGAEKINYSCGYCGVKNNLKTINEEHGIFQCLNCGAENHLIK